MKVASLLYHDVVTGSDFQSSGFSGADADIYKLTSEQFRRHLDLLQKSLPTAPVTIREVLERGTESAVLLTFDDGGASTWDQIAPLLEERGWRGHFFIPTDWIGKPGFMSAAQIRQIHTRGHVIGSHSCSHPPRISSLPREAILREWSDSARVLSDIVGEPVWTASVPAGYYSALVGEAAASAGFKALFHSEPVTTVERLHNCLLLGRYSVQQSTPPEIAAELATGRGPSRTRQYVYWQTKKLLKRAGGDLWLRFRRAWHKRVS